MYSVFLRTVVKSYFSHGGSTVHRFPGFAQGYAGGKRVEIKSTPSRVCRQFMMRNFDEVCKLVLKHKTSRNPLIQQTLLILLPRIAALNQELFALKLVRTVIRLCKTIGPTNIHGTLYFYCTFSCHSLCGWSMCLHVYCTPVVPVMV